MSPSPEHPERNTFLRGFGLAMALNLIQIPLAVVTMGFALFAVGLTQLAYVIPIAVKAYKRHEISRLQGILVAAGITILINGICDANLKRTMMPSPAEFERFGFAHGIAFVIVGQIVVALVVGVAQLLYGIQIELIAFVRGETKVAQGALLAAGLVFLLNSLFCAIMFKGFNRV